MIRFHLPTEFLITQIAQAAGNFVGEQVCKRVCSADSPPPTFHLLDRSRIPQQNCQLHMQAITREQSNKLKQSYAQLFLSILQ